MSDPTTVTAEQLRAAYDALGLDPELWTRTRRIEIAPGKVRVIRFQLNDAGRFFLGEDGDFAVTVTEVGSGRAPVGDMAQMLHDSFADGQQLLDALDAAPGIVDAIAAHPGVGQVTLPPPREQPAPTIRVVSWDWREQPDLAELRDILTPHGIHLVSVATGSDQYAVAISTAPISQDQADEAYRLRGEGEAP